MSRYRRLKAAYDFKQRTVRMNAELRWHALTLPKATLGWMFASFEFVSVCAIVALVVMLKSNPGAFALHPVQVTHPASNLLTKLTDKRATLTASTAANATASSSPSQTDHAGAFVSAAAMKPDTRTEALFGNQRPEHFARYFAYLDSVRGRIADDTFAFFTDYKRYSFSDEKSLFGLSLSRVEHDANTLSVFLSDPVFDRTMTLTYRDVSRSNIERWRDAPGLLSHELVIDDAGQHIHSLIFTDSDVMQIVARSIEIDDDPVN